jgi:hypothetical protein
MSDSADTSINSKVACSASKQTRFCPNFPTLCAVEEALGSPDSMHGKIGQIAVMPLEPTSGVKASKPRLKTAKEEIPKLSREYLVHRNEQMRTKNLRAQMELARERGELISKRLAGNRPHIYSSRCGKKS